MFFHFSSSDIDIEDHKFLKEKQRRLFWDVLGFKLSNWLFNVYFKKIELHVLSYASEEKVTEVFNMAAPKCCITMYYDEAIFYDNFCTGVWSE